MNRARLTYDNLTAFTREYDKCPPQLIITGRLRFGQAACNYFDLPKKLEDKIYYSEDRMFVESELWMEVKEK